MSEKETVTLSETIDKTEVTEEPRLWLIKSSSEDIATGDPDTVSAEVIRAPKSEIDDLERDLSAGPLAQFYVIHSADNPGTVASWRGDFAWAFEGGDEG